MAYPEKEERNKEIVRLHDEEGWSFSRIGRYFNIKKETAFKAYKLRKSKALAVVDNSAKKQLDSS